MPTRRVHNKIAKMFGLDSLVSDDVNSRKDSPSQVTPGTLHRGYNHGLFTNIKYGRLYGWEGIIAGFVHDSVDRIDGFNKRGLSGALFLRERILTWKLGKGLRNLLDPDYNES